MQSSGLPTSFRQRPYNYPDLFVSIFEFCIAGLVAAVLNYFFQRPGPQRVRQVRSSAVVDAPQIASQAVAATPAQRPVSQAAVIPAYAQAPVAPPISVPSIPQPSMAQTPITQPAAYQAEAADYAVSAAGDPSLRPQWLRPPTAAIPRTRAECAAIAQTGCLCCASGLGLGSQAPAAGSGKACTLQAEKAQRGLLQYRGRASTLRRRLKLEAVESGYSLWWGGSARPRGGNLLLRPSCWSDRVARGTAVFKME